MNIKPLTDEQREWLNNYGPFYTRHCAVCGEHIARIDDKALSRTDTIKAADILNAARDMDAEIERLKDDSQGTMLGRFNALAKWAEESLGHSPISSRGFEGTIYSTFENLKEDNARLREEVDDLQESIAALLRGGQA